MEVFVWSGQVLGTMYRPTHDDCSDMFSSPEAATRTAQQLADIAAYLRFDGWFIEVERDVDVSMVGNLQLFLRQVLVGYWPCYMAPPLQQ